MSYMLQFPSGSTAKDLTSPPYALFGINDADVFGHLPPKIPLALVLHFAPKLRTWIMPTPDLSRAAINLALRTPYTGVNIIADVEVEGLSWIVARMLQLGGLAVERDMFLTQPNILTCVSIHKAWLALELPATGIESLDVHLLGMLMLGDAVVLSEIQALWSIFIPTSLIIQQTGLNFIRSHINRSYTKNEFSTIRYWYLDTRERTCFFRGLEKQFPAFERVQDSAAQTISPSYGAAVAATKNGEARKDAATEKLQTLDKGSTKRVIADESRMRRKDQTSLKMKMLHRAGSDASLKSVETAIYDPQTPDAQSNKADTVEVARLRALDQNSSAVDRQTLHEMLKMMAVAERTEHEREEAPKRRGTGLTMYQKPV